MITVRILEANLKALPGKITLLVTEPLTHSLPYLSRLQSSHRQREGGEGTLLALKYTAEGWTLHLSGRINAHYWEKPLQHTEHWPPDRHRAREQSITPMGVPSRQGAGHLLLPLPQ